MKSSSTRAFLLLIAASTIASAQTPESEPSLPPVSIGVIGWGTMNLHRGDFTTYDGILECGTFDKAQTLGWGLGYSIEIPFAHALSLSGRLYYWKGDGEFVTPNPTAVRIAVDDKTIVPLRTEETLQTALDYGMADVLAKWRFASPFYLAIGPSVGFAARAAYEQEERIISPAGVTFLNGESTRKIIAGNFDEQGTLNTTRLARIGATAMIGAEIPLSKRLALTPEAGFTLGINSILSSFDWTLHAIRGGVGIAYSLGGGSPDTVLLPGPAGVPPKPVVALSAHNRTGDVDLNYAEIVVNEERSTDLVPLLPYIFFDPNSNVVPTRYVGLAPGATSTFSEDALRDQTLGVYHNLLNIVAARMKKFAEAKITLTGCREPSDDTASTNALSASRAERVKEYLTGVWGISSDRITIQSRALPAEISNRSVADGREENRRVEIASSDPRVLAPVTKKFGGITIDPDAVILTPQVQSGESISGWKLEITSPAGTRILEKEGTGIPREEVVWTVAAGVAQQLAPNGATTTTLVTARLGATTDSGEAIVAQREIPVRHTFSSRRMNGEIVRDSLVERYSLIFFDFDAPEITDFNTYAMEMIRSRMRTNSKVRVTGLTDRIGDDAHNLALSQRRATATEQNIRSRIVPDVLTTEGAGETAVYDNDLPEGRMYNRTVIVEIVTPVDAQ